jgi:hypothetical protein
MRAPLLADKGQGRAQCSEHSTHPPASSLVAGGVWCGQSPEYKAAHMAVHTGKIHLRMGYGVLREHGLILMTTKYRATDPLPPFSPSPSHTGSPQPEAAQPRGKSQEPHTMHPVPYMPIVDPVYMPIIDPIYMPIVDPVLPVVDATADPRLPCACR